MPFPPGFSTGCTARGVLMWQIQRLLEIFLLPALYIGLSHTALASGFQTATYPGGASPNSVAAGDFNGGHILDIAVSVTTTDSVAILLGVGNGTFQPAVNYDVEGSPQGFAVADLNRDGKLDLAVSNECGADPVCRKGTVSVLLGKGGGTFQHQL